MRSPLSKLFAVSAILFIVTGAFAGTGSLSLTWDTNPEPDIAGYKVYWGTASGVYDQSDDVHETTAVVSDLTIGVRYYFAVTAYNEAGLESAYSQEVSTIVPPPPSSTPTPTPKGDGAGQKNLVNVSTRVSVYTDDNVMIGGFIVSGDADKTVVLRALGPSLVNAGVKGALIDPLLELYDSGGILIAQNDNWNSLPPESVPSGFELADPNESLISATLPPGIYTAVLRGVNGATGVALCELYDLAPDKASIRNISTRGVVGTGDDVLIGGFIIGGDESTRVMVRAIGPSLNSFGVAGALPDPILELHSADGSLIYENDDWRSEQEQQIVDSTLAPADDRDSAIIATLSPGNYTAIIRGKANNTGVALVEVYNLENP